MIYHYRQSDGSYITKRTEGPDGVAVYDSVDGAEDWYSPYFPKDDVKPKQVDKPATLDDFF